MSFPVMSNLNKNKRPHEGPGQHSDTYHSHYKHPRLGRDHVHTTQVQSVHEASATSDGSSLGNVGSASRRSNGTMPSCAPKPVDVPHVPQLQQTQPRKSRRRNQKPGNLPPLPPVTDPSLESAVFTHPVCLPGHNQNKLGKSYDRLEFLGDAYIELIATRLVYTQYPHMTAGRLSQQRESLVKNESLAAFSVAYGFEKRAKLPPKISGIPPPVSKSRFTDPEKQYIKMLGDVFEAYVAGIILSNASKGYQIAEEWLHRLWIPKLKAQNSAEVKEPPAADSKQQLARRILGRGARVEYREVAPPDMSESKSGKTWFTIGAFIVGWGWDGAKLGEGRALNKSKAGMIAAIEACKNPLTEQIEQIKREHDEKVAAEKATESAKADQQESQNSDRPDTLSPNFSEAETSEDEGENSDDSDESNDNDDNEDP